MTSVRYRLLLGALLGAVLAIACGSGQSSTKAPSSSTPTFVFAPRVGLVFRHEMKNLDEFAIADSPFRDSVEWRTVWEVTVSEKSDTYLYTRRLVALGLKVNGADILAGGEVEPRRAEIVQVMSHDGHVVDVTGTEQLTATLLSLVQKADQARVSERFSPQNLRALLRARAVDAFSEVVGKPAEVGASWGAGADYGPLRSKTIVVTSALGCGGRSCLKLVRTFDVDQKQVADGARQHAAAFVADFGGDPANVRMVDSNVKIEDTFVVEPLTCHFHDAELTQESNFTFEGPKGNRIKVVLMSKQTSHAEYPPPS